MFRIFKKLSSGFQMKRATSTRIVVDEESIKLFQKVIGECETSLMESKKHLAKVTAKKIVAKRKFDNQQEDVIDKQEALQSKRRQGDIPAARQIATELLTLEKWQEDNQQQLAQLEHHERNTQLVISNTASTLAEYRSELNVAFAANELGESLVDSPELSSESISKMLHSLNRLRSRQNNSDTVFG